MLEASFGGQVLVIVSGNQHTYTRVLSKKKKSIRICLLVYAPKFQAHVLSISVRVISVNECVTIGITSRLNLSQSKSNIVTKYQRGYCGTVATTAVEHSYRAFRNRRNTHTHINRRDFSVAFVLQCAILSISISIHFHFIIHPSFTPIHSSIHLPLPLYVIEGDPLPSSIQHRDVHLYPAVG